MQKKLIGSGAVLLGVLAAPHMAAAAVYTVACGTNGSSDLVQNQLQAIGSSSGNTIVVTGTCVGDLSVTHADRLGISGLTLNGDLVVDSAVTVTFGGLRLTGTLALVNARRTTFNNTVVNGQVQLRGSVAVFNGLTVPAGASSLGANSISCQGQSDCTFYSLALAGSGTGAGNGSAGLTAGSASRLSLYGGTITGFDIGVLVWNNAMAFLGTGCDNVNIQSNLTTGVYVTDGGVAKIEGLSATDAALDGCAGPSHGYITGNGSYGVLVDGGGSAFLFQTAISGHSIDGLRVQHGSTVRVRSSTIDAATTSGRSARVKAQAHLYFDELSNGPAASSTLAGPVCITGNSSIDTDNSSTVINSQSACTSP